MTNAVEHSLERAVFGSRWLQTPLYIGLILGSLLYSLKFLEKLWGMFTHFSEWHEEELMLAVLGLVDMTMVANLVYMVVLGGYSMFVSRIHLNDHMDKPEWLDKTNANTLKIKLAASLVGVSGIHLLKTFIEIGEASHETQNQPIPAFVMWQMLIHITFLGTAIALSLTERLLHPPHLHSPAANSPAASDHHMPEHVASTNRH